MKKKERRNREKAKKKKKKRKPMELRKRRKKKRKRKKKEKKYELTWLFRVGLIGFAGQTSHGSKWVIFKRVNRVTGRVYPYFSNKIFFFFNYKNKSMTACLEKMNKIN